MGKRRAFSTLLVITVISALSAGSANGNRQRSLSPLDQTDPSTNSWSAHCPYTEQVAKIDPIVFYDNDPHPPTHVHIFFGDVMDGGVTSTTTPRQLRDAAIVEGEYTTCLGPHLAHPPAGSCQRAPHRMCDKSAYWAPQLEDTSVADPDDPNSPDGWKPIPPAYVLVYYRNELVSPDQIHVFDQDLSMVAGSAMAMAPQPRWMITWSCVQGRHQTRAGVLMPNTCPIGTVGEGQNPDVYLRMVVTFPNCLKKGLKDDEHGMVIPAADQVAYTTDPQHHGACPAGFVTIPTIQVGVRWNLSTYGRSHRVGKQFRLADLYLSSDFMGDPNPQDGTWMARGQTAHADFESGWSHPVLNQLMYECFHSGPHNCGYVFGSGT